MLSRSRIALHAACRRTQRLGAKSHSRRLLSSESSSGADKQPLSPLTFMAGSCVLLITVAVLKQNGYDKKIERVVAPEDAQLKAVDRDSAENARPDMSKVGVAMVVGIAVGLIGGRLLAPKLFHNKHKTHGATKAVAAYLEQRGFPKPVEVEGIIGKFGENGASLSFESALEGRKVKVQAQAFRDSIADTWNCTQVKVTREDGFKVPLDKN